MADIEIKTNRLAVSQTEAARMLRINRDRVAAAVRSGELPLYQLPDSRASRILVSSIEDWVKSWPRKPRVRSRKDESNAVVA